MKIFASRTPYRSRRRRLALKEGSRYTLLMVLALAVGIGMNSAGFIFVNAIVLHPLPYPRFDRIMLVEESEQTINDGHWAAGSFAGRSWTLGWDRLSIRHDRVHEEYDPISVGKVMLPDSRGNAAFCDGHVEFVTRAFAHDPLHVVPVH